MDLEVIRRESEGESNDNSIVTDLQSLESDASSISLQQQRKLWRSKSTGKSELSVENSGVTNEELKELKQWFQVN